jgi:RNA processing factor Prp31
VQILGAEKALFRALKNRSNTPKYGLIYFSGYISKAKAKDKGRISRYLANKCSIASRIDAFSGIFFLSFLLFFLSSFFSSLLMCLIPCYL